MIALRLASVTGSMIVMLVSNPSVFICSISPHVVIAVLLIASRRILNFTFKRLTTELNLTTRDTIRMKTGHAENDST